MERRRLDGKVASRMLALQDVAFRMLRCDGAPS